MTMEIRKQMTKSLKNVAVIGNYLPRRCGIATFTYDICEALALEIEPSGSVYTLAMNDIPEGYKYPDRVRMELRANMVKDYVMASDFINIDSPDVVLLQHEFGIYGGPSGAYIIKLLKELSAPVVTTLHTVLKDPNSEQRQVMEELKSISEGFIVMSQRGANMLKEVYNVPEERVHYIPHGIPDVPFVDPNFYKDNFGVEGRRVILTFGLLSPGKGIEVLIDAMPEVVKQYPDVVYILLGATHPHIIKNYGEEYRYSLQQKVKQYNIQDNVIFIDRFVSIEELCAFIGAADIYVTPYLNKEQIVSGTLAYTLGAGKAIISTPYWYAEEMLGDERGVLFPFKDSEALSHSIIDLFKNETERHLMRKRAYQYSRNMVWKSVANAYIDVFKGVINERSVSAHPSSIVKSGEYPDRWEIPEIDLKHLRTISDDTGIIQHAIHAIPDRQHGYCTCDNSRAFIATLMYYKLWEDNSVINLMQTYLAFLMDAFNTEARRFRNFMSYDRKWLEEIGSEDSHCRALWALGMGVAFAPNHSIRNLCVRMFNEALPVVEGFTSPRGWANVIVGIHYYLRKFNGDAVVKRYREILSRKLQNLFDVNAADDWPWLENYVTYDNGRICEALLLSGQWLPDSRMIETGLRSLDWLMQIQTGDEDQLSIIGNDGWYKRGGKHALFDQQPVEAMMLNSACLEAFNITRDDRWINEAKKCFDWFLGRNDLKTPIYDFMTGGCRDGLNQNGVNENQGAESTLSWLITLLSLNNIYGETFHSKTDVQQNSDSNEESENTDSDLSEEKAESI